MTQWDSTQVTVTTGAPSDPELLLDGSYLLKVSDALLLRGLVARRDRLLLCVRVRPSGRRHACEPSVCLRFGFNVTALSYLSKPTPYFKRSAVTPGQRVS